MGQMRPHRLDFNGRNLWIFDKLGRLDGKKTVVDHSGNFSSRRRETFPRQHDNVKLGNDLAFHDETKLARPGRFVEDFGKATKRRRKNVRRLVMVAQPTNRVNTRHSL
jgi:hypothetical protein